MKTSSTTTVVTEDLWEALEVLSSLPEALGSEWYKRLETAAELATQQMAMDKGLMDWH